MRHMPNWNKSFSGQNWEFMAKIETGSALQHLKILRSLAFVQVHIRWVDQSVFRDVSCYSTFWFNFGFNLKNSKWIKFAEWTRKWTKLKWMKPNKIKWNNERVLLLIQTQCYSNSEPRFFLESMVFLKKIKCKSQALLFEKNWDKLRFIAEHDFH